MVGRGMCMFMCGCVGYVSFAVGLYVPVCVKTTSVQFPLQLVGLISSAVIAVVLVLMGFVFEQLPRVSLVSGSYVEYSINILCDASKVSAS